jgi:hypothetical protein
MGTARRLKVWLIAAASVTVLALAIAAGAEAKASFSVQTRTGFISRGDVLSAGGKGALVADPLVAYQSTQSFTETCTWVNGTSVQASGSQFLFLLFQAETRYAPGSHKIIGYAISPSDIVDGQTNEAGEDRALCWEARGLPDDGSQITQTFAFGPKVTSLTLFGANSAVELPFSSH